MNLFLEIKFVGGLGNQLFQYAAGRGLCIENKIPYLLLNTESYKNESLGRTFGLNDFNIKGTVVSNGTILKIFRAKTKLNKLFTNFLLHKVVRENGFVLQQVKYKTGVLTSLEGYWQSPFYFDNIREILLKEIIPRHLPALPGWIAKNNTVAIHVRRTDYLNEKRYGFLGIGYYEAAIAVMKEKLNDPVFVLFSDDMPWCKAAFKTSNIIFCEEVLWGKDHLQLYLISCCTHQVIANSSFSWWGAWLNDNPQKIVIRPATPFQDKSLLYQSHYPGQWIAINN